MGEVVGEQFGGGQGGAAFGGVGAAHLHQQVAGGGVEGHLVQGVEELGLGLGQAAQTPVELDDRSARSCCSGVRGERWCRRAWEKAWYCSWDSLERTGVEEEAGRG